jgi:hypothetical protein
MVNPLMVGLEFKLLDLKKINRRELLSGVWRGQGRKDAFDWSRIKLPQKREFEWWLVMVMSIYRAAKEHRAW